MLLPVLYIGFAGVSNAFSFKYHTSHRQEISPRSNIVPRQNISTTPGTSTPDPAPITGVATFVDFAHEPNTVCGPLSGTSGLSHVSPGHPVSVALEISSAQLSHGRIKTVDKEVTDSNCRREWGLGCCGGKHFAWTWIWWRMCGDDRYGMPLRN